MEIELLMRIRMVVVCVPLVPISECICQSGPERIIIEKMWMFYRDVQVDIWFRSGPLLVHEPEVNQIITI